MAPEGCYDRRGIPRSTSFGVAGGRGLREHCRVTMTRRMRPILAMAAAAGAASLWAYDLAVLQPLTEPAKSWSDAVAESNTY